MEPKKEDIPKTDQKTHAVISLITNGAFWTVIPFIVAGSLFCGTIIFDQTKIDLYEENKNLKKEIIEKSTRISELMKDSLECLAAINKLQNLYNEKQETENQTQTTDKTDKLKKNQDNISGNNNSEIKKLRTENNELKINIELIQSEKSELKRKVQRYISKQDSLISELEILQDKIKYTQGKEKQDAEKEFSDLLKKVKEERLKFDETMEGKELKQEVEEYKKKQAEIEKENKEQQQKLEELKNELANLKSNNANDYFNSSNVTLKSAENMFNWFGINNKEKCNLIKQVAQSYNEATKLGKDCSKEKEELKSKYPKCF